MRLCRQKKKERNRETERENIREKFVPHSCNAILCGYVVDVAIFCFAVFFICLANWPFYLLAELYTAIPISVQLNLSFSCKREKKFYRIYRFLHVLNHHQNVKEFCQFNRFYGGKIAI